MLLPLNKETGEFFRSLPEDLQQLITRYYEESRSFDPNGEVIQEIVSHMWCEYQCTIVKGDLTEQAMRKALRKTLGTYDIQRLTDTHSVCSQAFYLDCRLIHHLDWNGRKSYRNVMAIARIFVAIIFLVAAVYSAVPHWAAQNDLLLCMTAGMPACMLIMWPLLIDLCTWGTLHSDKHYLRILRDPELWITLSLGGIGITLAASLSKWGGLFNTGHFIPADLWVPLEYFVFAVISLPFCLVVASMDSKMDERKRIAKR